MQILTEKKKFLILHHKFINILNKFIKLHAILSVIIITNKDVHLKHFSTNEVLKTEGHFKF